MEANIWAIFECCALRQWKRNIELLYLERKCHCKNEIDWELLVKMIILMIQAGCNMKMQL